MRRTVSNTTAAARGPMRTPITTTPHAQSTRGSRVRQGELPGVLEPRATRPQYFRRTRKGYWQVRFYFNGVLHRRSCATRRKPDARTVATLWIRQIERRGKPSFATCLADHETNKARQA